MTPIKAAIDIVGTAKLALLLRIAVPSVSKWAAGTRPVPREHIPAIELATNGQVRCEDLCPDVAWIRDAEGKPFKYTVTIKAA